MERVVVALGGNALLRRGADDTYEEMYRAARDARRSGSPTSPPTAGRSSSPTATARRSAGS